MFSTREGNGRGVELVLSLSNWRLVHWALCIPFNQIPQVVKPFVCLCGRDLPSWRSWRSICRCSLQMSPSRHSLLLTTLSCHLLPLFVSMSIPFLLVSFLLLSCLSHLPPSSPDSDLTFALLPCTCNLARRPPVLSQISCQNSLLGDVFSTLPQ